MQVVVNIGMVGFGVFYWEFVWILVGLKIQVEKNKVLWDIYGLGWVFSYVVEYDFEDVGKWYGGSVVDN